ncbi:MAG: hypothetical protein AAF202_05920, partial [Pseudomonadota bacterium]
MKTYLFSGKEAPIISTSEDFLPNPLKPRKLLIESLFEAGLQIVPIIKHRWAWLLFTMAIGLACEGYFEYMMNLHRDNDVLRMVSQLGLATSALLVSLCVLFIAPLTIVDVEKKRELSSVWDFSAYHFWPLTLESVRALAHVLFFIAFFAIVCFALLAGAYYYVLPNLPNDQARLAVTTAIVVICLVLPGFYKFMRLHFMPYIIMFDPRYDAGEVNAIERPHQLTKPIFWWLFFFLLFGTFIELGLDAPAGFLEGTTRDVVRIAISPLTIVFSVYSVSVS